ncbi:Uncharacterised protein [uncultured archaeon]|nr:Uncharacterised protein [uncultured archaeon]
MMVLMGYETILNDTVLSQQIDTALYDVIRHEIIIGRTLSSILKIQENLCASDFEVIPAYHHDFADYVSKKIPIIYMEIKQERRNEKMQKKGLRKEKRQKIADKKWGINIGTYTFFGDEQGEGRLRTALYNMIKRNLDKGYRPWVWLDKWNNQTNIERDLESEILPKYHDAFSEYLHGLYPIIYKKVRADISEAENKKRFEEIRKERKILSELSCEDLRATLPDYARNQIAIYKEKHK